MEEQTQDITHHLPFPFTLISHDWHSKVHSLYSCTLPFPLAILPLQSLPPFIPLCRLSMSSPIEIISITNKSGLRANLLSWGATLVSVYFPDKEGNERDLILGFDTAQEYIEGRTYFGHTVGRVANRIKEGRIEIEGKVIQLECNRQPHHLHGGTNTVAHRNWQVHRYCENSVTLMIEVKSEDDGYPGDVLFKTTYIVNDLNQLLIEHFAQVSSPCPINLTNHAYWNLDGSHSILNHHLQISSSSFLAVDSVAMPTGEISTVDGTSFDYRTLRRVGPRAWQDPPAVELDNDFVLDEREKGENVMMLESELSGIRMTISTSYPVIHLFTANNFNGSLKGKGGIPMECHGGLAIEAQKYSGAPSYTHFPSVLLRPEDTYEEEVIYTFSHI